MVRMEAFVSGQGRHRSLVGVLETEVVGANLFPVWWGKATRQSRSLATLDKSWNTEGMTFHKYLPRSTTGSSLAIA